MIYSMMNYSKTVINRYEQNAHSKLHIKNVYIYIYNICRSFGGLSGRPELGLSQKLM